MRKILLIILFTPITTGYMQGFYDYSSMINEFGCSHSGQKEIEQTIECFFEKMVKKYNSEIDKMTQYDEFESTLDRNNKSEKARQYVNMRFKGSELAGIPFKLPSYNADKEFFGAGYIKHGYIRGISFIDNIGGIEIKDFRFKYYIQMPPEEARVFKEEIKNSRLYYNFDIEKLKTGKIVIRINNVILYDGIFISNVKWNFTTGINLY